jgi:hypothetical protein
VTNVKWRQPETAKVTDVTEVIRVKTCEKCRQSELFRLSTLMSTATVSVSVNVYIVKHPTR